MESFNILYIDDQIDSNISEFLYKYKKDDVEIYYEELEFDKAKGYEGLLSKEQVREANLIFIDSQLFKNSDAAEGKYTGEQFKLILRKIYPYIEVIVITQNEISPEYKTIAKYDPRSNDTPMDYYRDRIPVVINEAIRSILEYRKIIDEMSSTDDSKYLLEKIINSLNGNGLYDELTKKDIDNLVNTFLKLQESLDG